MRRLCFGLIAFLALFDSSQAQEKLSKRYGFDLSLEFYPQKTPKDALLSIGKAVDVKRMDYVLAHLADPRYVDDTVTAYKYSMRQGDDKARVFLAFDRLVAETTQYFLDDPSLLKELRIFAKEAEWEMSDAEAVGTLKSVQGRKVFLRKHEDRWFLENRQQ